MFNQNEPILLSLFQHKRVREEEEDEEKTSFPSNTTVAYWLCAKIQSECFQCECNYTLANNRETNSLLFNTSSVILPDPSMKKKITL